MKYLAISFLLCILFSPALARASLPTQPKGLYVIRVTPEGVDIPITTRNILIQFNRPVIPINKTQQSSTETQITFTPTLHCNWHWLSTQILACHLDPQNTLQPATRYLLTILPSIKAEDGAMLAKPYQHSFITERPNIKQASIITWDGPDIPVIKLSTTQPVSADSLYRHLLLIAQSKMKKIYPIQIQHNIEQESNYLKLLDDSFTQGISEEGATQWLVIPAEILPLDATLSLKIIPGLQSLLGSEKSVADKEVISIHTFPEFRFLGIQCQSNQGELVTITAETPQTTDRPCSSTHPISLMFNAPVSALQVKKYIQFLPALPGIENLDHWQIKKETGRPNIPGEHQSNSIYTVFIPPPKAGQKYLVSVKTTTSQNFLDKLWHKLGTFLFIKTELMTELTDQFGRKLIAPKNFQFTTAQTTGS